MIGPLVGALVALALLVGIAGQARAARGGTLVVTTEGNPDFLDPAFAYAPESWQILVNTGNGLVALRREAGVRGAEIVPDLAVALPTVAEGGRLLAFTLRRGVRFSPPVSREVLPSDVKASLERLVLVSSNGAGLYANIAGWADLARTGRGGLRGVIADDAARRLTIRLEEPDPSFLAALALPFAQVVPRETPAVDQSTKPPVATGPYQVTRYEPNDRIELSRNPSFAQWSPDVPDGQADRIVVEIGVPAGDALTRIARGEADFTQSRLSTGTLDPVRAARSAAVYRNVELATYYFFMNVNVAPFDDVRVRRAVNLAVDREEIVRLFGGEAIPTAQVLPPGIPGFRRIDPFPGPDLDLARALVRRAGASGATVTIWGHNTEPSPSVTRYLERVLRSLGFRARIRFLDKPTLLTTIGDRRTRAQIGYARWQGDYPDGGDWFGLLLYGRRLRAGDNLNYSYIDDPALNRAIASASAEADPVERAEAWSRVERAVAARAPWVPFANSVRNDVVSTRVRGYVYHQTFGFLWTLASVR